jgi:hypothetical protein
MAIHVLGVRSTTGAFQLEGAGAQYIPTANLYGLGQSDIWTWTGSVIAKKFATVESRGSLKVATDGVATGYTSIGTFTDRVHNSEVGDHPITANDTSDVNVYTFQQYTTAITDNKTVRPLCFDDSTKEVREMTDAEIDSEIMDMLVDRWWDSFYMTGKYWLKQGTDAPALADGAGTHTYTERYTINDTQTDDTTVTYKLWQQTESALENHTVGTGGLSRPLIKFNSDKEIVELTVAETESLVDRFRNRISTTTVGTYRLSTDEPTETGTWNQQGGTLTDQVKTSTDVTYSGSYDGTYSGDYDGTYTGSYENTFTGSYAADYGGFAGESYSGDYTGYFDGDYTGSYTGSYTGTYTGEYDGLTLQTTSSTQESKKLFARTG